jgi:hypothetical protein
MADAAALSIVVFNKVVALLGKLSDEQLAALANGTGDLQFVSAGVTVTAAARRASPSPRAAKAAGPGAEEVAAHLPSLTDQAEAEKYLRDSKLTIDGLKDVADRLKVTVRGKRKDQIIQELASGAGAFRSKFGAVMGGPYRQ